MNETTQFLVSRLAKTRKLAFSTRFPTNSVTDRVRNEVENRLTGAKIVGGLGESVGKGRGRGSPCRAKERGCGTSPCTDERLHPSLWSQVHDTSSCVARCLDDASTRVFRAACASYALHGVREKRVWNFLDGIRSKRIPVERRNSSAKSLWVNDSYTWITMIFFFSREQVAILRIRDEYIRRRMYCFFINFGDYEKRRIFLTLHSIFWFVSFICIYVFIDFLLFYFIFLYIYFFIYLYILFIYLLFYSIKHNVNSFYRYLVIHF